MGNVKEFVSVISLFTTVPLVPVTLRWCGGIQSTPPYGFYNPLNLKTVYSTALNSLNSLHNYEQILCKKVDIKLSRTKFSHISGQWHAFQDLIILRKKRK